MVHIENPTRKSQKGTTKEPMGVQSMSTVAEKPADVVFGLLLGSGLRRSWTYPKGLSPETPIFRN